MSRFTCEGGYVRLTSDTMSEGHTAYYFQSEVMYEAGQKAVEQYANPDGSDLDLDEHGEIIAVDLWLRELNDADAQVIVDANEELIAKEFPKP